MRRTHTSAVAPPLLRVMNQRALLDHLYAAQAALTRRQLAKACGLSQPTVAAALDELQTAGLVVTSAASAAIGRPAVAFAINPEGGFVLAVDVGRKWIRALLTDLTGADLVRRDIPNTATSAARLVQLIAGHRRDVALQAGIGVDRIAQTVIASPGALDTRHGCVRYAANLPGWQRPGLAAALSERLDSALLIDNDANLAAIAEHRLGAGRGLDSFVYLHIGTGIGLGIIANGELYRGATGAAGEIGYMPAAVDAPQPARLCSRGATEELLAADALLRYARDAGSTRSSTEQVFADAQAGEMPALLALDRYAALLANLISGVCAILDPETIVLGGGIGQNLDVLQTPVCDGLKLNSPMQPQLRAAELGAESALRGAAVSGLVLARDRAFDTS